MRLLAWMVLGAAALLAQGAHDAVADLNIGKKIFESQCALCHGPDGSGGKGPSLRKAKLKKAADDEALRKAIADGIEPEMPGAWQLSVREVASVAGYVRSLGKIKIEEISGVPAVGEKLFVKNGCGNCHIVKGEGNGRGPELTAIGAKRNAKHLRESIVNPSAEVPVGFLIVEVTDKAGKKTRGVKVNEDLFTIQLALSSGKHQSFEKAAVKELKRLPGQSTMPAFDKLPAADLDDLIAYLASLRGTE